MTAAAQQFCAEPGCPVLVARGRCPEHTRARQQQHDRFQDRETRYDSARWRKARARFLSQPEHVLCRTCKAKGIRRRANTVDHVQPHRGDAGLFWDRSNWQPLCGPCHSAKTAAETAGFRRREGVAPQKVWNILPRSTALRSSAGVERSKVSR
jgi:5-methylcytosine-specific restriction protein A